MELSTKTIITGFLALIIILYAYNDFIKPLAISLYKSISEAKTVRKKIPFKNNKNVSIKLDLKDERSNCN